MCFKYNVFSCTCVHAKVLKLCPTLFSPIGCSLPGSSVLGFSRQEYWSGLPCLPPGGSQGWLPFKWGFIIVRTQHRRNQRKKLVSLREGPRPHWPCTLSLREDLTPSWCPNRSLYELLAPTDSREAGGTRCRRPALPGHPHCCRTCPALTSAFSHKLSA